MGRDTASLSKEGIIRAVVETIAENMADGVIAPLFYAMILERLLHSHIKR